MSTCRSSELPWPYSTIGRAPLQAGALPVGTISAPEAVVFSPPAPTVAYSKWCTSMPHAGAPAMAASCVPKLPYDAMRAHAGVVDDRGNAARAFAQCAVQFTDAQLLVAREQHFTGRQHLAAGVGQGAEHALRAESLRELLVLHQAILERECGSDGRATQRLERRGHAVGLRADDEAPGATELRRIRQHRHRLSELREPADAQTLLFDLLRTRTAREQQDRAAGARQVRADD